MRGDVDLGIQIEDALARGIELLAPDVGRAVEDLPVQIREIDAIEVDEPDPADPRRREIGRNGAAEASGADDERGAGAESALAFGADLGKGDLAGVAGQGRRRDTIS